MSLRKATCLTPRRVDAARHNSERSTGPRSEAGKERVKMNASSTAVMRRLKTRPP